MLCTDPRTTEEPAERLAYAVQRSRPDHCPEHNP